MAILWFGGFSRYQLNSSANTLPAKRASMPFPPHNGIRLRHNGANANWMTVSLPNILEAGSRNWLHIQSNTARTVVANQFFELGLFARDIPEEYRKVDTVICAGFRFRTAVVNQPSKYLVFGLLDPSVNLNTGVTSLMTERVYPLHEQALHPLTVNTTQEKYIEFRVRYREENKVLLKMFVNKDLVLERVLDWDQEWAMIAGCPQGSDLWYANQSSTNATTRRGSVYFNDIYLGVDMAGDRDPTGLVGPVTVKPLELEEVTVEGEWASSVVDETVGQTLAKKIPANTLDMTTNYVISDPGDKPATFKFVEPAEPLKIVAFQQDFIAQQPLAYSTALQYERTYEGVNIESTGRKITKNIALEPGVERVATQAMNYTHDGKPLTPQYIGNVLLHINSTLKQIDDDEVFIPEDEIIEIPEE